MVSLFSSRRIIREHIKSVGDDTSRASSYAVFLLLPLLISVLLVVLFGQRMYALSDTLILVFSILTGLLLNMAFVLFGIFSGADKQDYKTDTSKRELVHALHFNTLYTILVSVTTLAVLLLCAFSDFWRWDPIHIMYGPVSMYFYIQEPAAILVYFIVFHFVMNILLILKRLESLVSLQTDSQSGT